MSERDEADEGDEDLDYLASSSGRMTEEATMRSTRLGCLTLGFALLVSAQSVLATESARAAQAGRIAMPRGQPTSRANPYGGLFKAPDITKSAASSVSEPTETRGPRIVCGMTVIPADPNVDPTIAIPSRRDNTRFTIRAIEPPICK